MKQVLYKTFKIEQSESSSVLILICQSFFLGIFYGSFDIVASALFLESFPASMFPKAFVVSGVAGILMTAIYTKLQTKISFSRLAWINLLFITIITIMLRLGYYYTSVKWMPFMMIVLLGPLNIVAMLGFWGVAGRVFSLRQAKRLFGLIDSGQVFGVIVSSYAIPFILVLNFSTKNILFICSFSVLMALIMQLIISSKFKINELKETANDTVKKANTNLLGLFKNKFVLYMSLFVVLSMISAFFIYYSFLSVLNIKYPDSKELAKFLGLFTGTVMIFSFIFKTFVYSKIMQTYNLRISLLILPSLLFLLSALAVVVGIAFGYTAETAGFILFFLLISLCRLFSRSLKESIESPSFKILYLSLDKNIRYDIQARIDGVVNEFAALFSGLTLAVLGTLSFIHAIHYTYVLIIILIIWFFVTIRLYKEYKNSLATSLTKNGNKNNLTEKSFKKSLLENRTNGNPDLTINRLNIARICEPVLFEKVLPDFLSHQTDQVHRFVLNKIADNEIFSAIKAIDDYILKEKNVELKHLAMHIKADFSTKSNDHFDKAYVTDLIKSKYAEKREFAAKMIGLRNEEIYFPFLIALLRDIDSNVRVSAIKSCAIIKFKEVCPLLIEYLSDAQYVSCASEALVAIGDDALDSLELSFYKSDLNNNIQKRMICIFGEIGGGKAISYLINKLNFPQREIARQAFISLSECHYKFEEQHLIPIRHAIDLTISIIAWNLAAAFNSRDLDCNEELRNALDSELKENYDDIYLLLSLMYDPIMILTARDNIENGSSEGVGYALELLDLYVADDLKPILFPLFENITLVEKVKRLQDFYPLEKQDALTLLNTIVARDINYINRWTKSCAIYNLRDFENVRANNDLLAHLFNKDKLIFETAGLVIHKIDPEAYNNSCKRISVKLRNELDYMLILATEKQTHILYQKVKFLKSIQLFRSLNDVVISEVAEAMEEKIVDSREILFVKNEINNPKLFFVINGKIVLTCYGKARSEYSNGSLLTEYMLLDSFAESAGFIATIKTTVYFINNKNLQHLMLYHDDFSELMLKTAEIV